MNKVLEYIIEAKDKTGEAVNSALGRVKSFSSGVLGQLANIKAGLEMAWEVAKKFAQIFGTAIKEAFKFEKVQSDFAGLLNSIDKAKEHIADLRKFASSTPLTFEDLSKASKLLLSFGMDVESVMPSLKMLGDIAMGNGEKFAGLSLVFAQVQSAGKLMGQDLLQMINQGFNPLTVIAKETGKTMSELKKMMSDGAISFEMVAEAMRVATSEGGLFNNSMAHAAQTGEGLMSTLQDKWTDAVRTFGEAFTDLSKGALQMLIDKLTKLVESGEVEVWAYKIADAFAGIVEFAEACATAIGKVVDVYREIQDFGERVGSAVGGFVGAIAGGGDYRAANEAVEAYNATLQEQKDTLEEIKGLKEEICGLDTSSASASGTSAGGVTSTQVEQAKNLAGMVAEAETEARVKAEKEIAKERDKLMQETVDKYTKAVSDWQKENAEAKSALATATAKVESLWGYYEDPEKYQSYLAEQQAAAAKRSAAEERFWNDYANLGRVGESHTTDALAAEMANALAEQQAAAEWEKLTAERAAEAVQQLKNVNANLANGRLE